MITAAATAALPERLPGPRAPRFAPPPRFCAFEPRRRPWRLRRLGSVRPGGVFAANPFAPFDVNVAARTLPYSFARSASSLRLRAFGSFSLRLFLQPRLLLLGSHFGIAGGRCSSSSSSPSRSRRGDECEVWVGELEGAGDQLAVLVPGRGGAVRRPSGQIPARDSGPGPSGTSGAPAERDGPLFQPFLRLL